MTIQIEREERIARGLEYIVYIRQKADAATFKTFTYIKDEILRSIASIVSTRWYLDSFEETETTVFLMGRSDERNREIAELYVERNLRIDGVSDEKKKRFKEVFLQIIPLYQNLIGQLAAQLGIGKIDLYYSILEEGKITFDFAGAVGGSLSPSSPAIILADFPVFSEEALDGFLEGGAKEKLHPSSKFMVAHELIHIAQNHKWQKVALRVAILALCALACVGAAKVCVAWGSYCVLVTSMTLLINTVGQIFLQQQSVAHEVEADRGAMDLLQSNEGAIAFWLFWIELRKEMKEVGRPFGPGFTHPTDAERLALAEAWTPREQVLPTSGKL